MKSKIFYSLAIIVVFFGVLFANNTAKADCQCPTDIPPLELAWHSEGPIEVTIWDGPGYPLGNPCTFIVNYCWRDWNDLITPEPNMIDIYVCDYTPTAGCDNFTLAVWQIYKRLGKRIIETNPDNRNWPVPSCPNNVPNYSTYSFTCYNVQNFPCGSIYCRYLYAVCWETQRIATEVGSETIGPDCPTGCTSHCGE